MFQYTLHKIDLKNNEFALVTDEFLNKINEEVLRILDLYTEKSNILLKGIINERRKWDLLPLEEISNE